LDASHAGRAGNGVKGGKYIFNSNFAIKGCSREMSKGVGNLTIFEASFGGDNQP
jgi:hypothetical protein